MSYSFAIILMLAILGPFYCIGAARAPEQRGNENCGMGSRPATQAQFWSSLWWQHTSRISFGRTSHPIDGPSESSEQASRTRLRSKPRVAHCVNRVPLKLATTKICCRWCESYFNFRTRKIVSVYNSLIVGTQG